jgi:hypothetical protein
MRPASSTAANPRFRFISLVSLSDAPELRLHGH